MIKFNKIRDVKDPERRVGNDAGFDFYVPADTEKFRTDFANKNEFAYLNETGIVIPAGKDVMIPSGIKTKFDNDIALIAMNKSGIASKQKLTVGACVIDSSYQGETHIHLFNMSDKDITVPFGQKIVQFVPYRIDLNAYVVEDGLSDDEFFDGVSVRGAGGFGSTGV